MKKKLAVTLALFIVLTLGIGLVAAPPNPPDTPEDPTEDPPEDPGGTTGGGTDTPYNPPTANQDPVIVLEWDFISVEFGEKVILDASQCYDPDGTIVKIEWKGGNTVLSEDVIFEYSPKIGTQTIRLIIYDNKDNVTEGEVKIRCIYTPPTTAPPATTLPPETMPPTTTPAPITPLPTAPAIHVADYPSVMAVLNCPAHLHAYDAEGNHIGLTDEGIIENEIPGGYYSGSDHSPEVIMVTNPQGQIYFTAESYEAGTFTLTIMDVEDEDVHVYSFEDVEMDSQSIFSTSTDYTFGQFEEDGLLLESIISNEGDDAANNNGVPTTIPMYAIAAACVCLLVASIAFVRKK